MPQVVDSTNVTFSLDRRAADHITRMSPAMADRMHHLLERNTDGDLNPIEHAELEALVELAQVKHLLTLAIAAATAGVGP